MTEYLTAPEMKELLVAGLKIQLRDAEKAFDEVPHDQGDPATGRPSTRDAIGVSARLLHEVEDLPADDQRIVRLAELMPSVDALIAVIPGAGPFPIGSADVYLNALIDCAVQEAGS